MWLKKLSVSKHFGTLGLWDEQDGFYYDHLKIGDEPAKALPVRSMVGLVPLFRYDKCISRTFFKLHSSCTNHFTIHTNVLCSPVALSWKTPESKD